MHGSCALAQRCWRRCCTAAAAACCDQNPMLQLRALRCAVIYVCCTRHGLQSLHLRILNRRPPCSPLVCRRRARQATALWRLVPRLRLSP